MTELSSRLAPMIQDYIDFRTATGRSGYHMRYLKLFDRYCAEHYPELDTLSREAVRDWFSYEASQNPTCLNAKATSIRLFAQYLGNGAYVLPANVISKNPSFLPHIFTDEELAAFFKVADSYESKDSFIHEVIPVLFRLLYTCGLRPREGWMLEREYINFTTGEIIITKTKQLKERVVVMSDDMLLLCKKYDAMRSAVAGDSKLFFVRGNGNKITYDQLRMIFIDCWKRANPGITESKLPQTRMYDLRHRFASTVLQNWLDEGRDLYSMLPYLRTYMGHAHFEDTLYYIHLLPGRLLNSPSVKWENFDKVGPGVEVWAH